MISIEDKLEYLERQLALLHQRQPTAPEINVVLSIVDDYRQMQTRLDDFIKELADIRSQEICTRGIN